MKIYFGCVFLLTTSLGFAGGDKGNGGGVHLCPNSIEMYDLYEGSVRYEMDMVENDLSVEEYFERGLGKIHNAHPVLASKLRRTFDYFIGHLRIKSGINLPKIDDANILIVQKGCSYEQLANWDEVSGNILVNKDLYDQLSPKSVAAFYLHEVFYKVLREKFLESQITLKTSDFARRVVADAFSKSRELQQTQKYLINIFGESFAGLSEFVVQTGVEIVDESNRKTAYFNLGDLPLTIDNMNLFLIKQTVKAPTLQTKIAEATRDWQMKLDYYNQMPDRRPKDQEAKWKYKIDILDKAEYDLKSLQNQLESTGDVTIKGNYTQAQVDHGVGLSLFYLRYPGSVDYTLDASFIFNNEVFQTFHYEGRAGGQVDLSYNIKVTVNPKIIH